MSSTETKKAEPPIPADDVRGFWPEPRIDTLRRMARDTTVPDDQFARSKMFAWMREFCLDAPSWLQTMAARERLRAKAEAALSSCRAAAAQMQAVLDDLDAMGAPDEPQIDRWAAQVAAAPADMVAAQITPPPAGKGFTRMRQVHLTEAIAEADARAKDAPKGPAKLPAPGEKLPSEKAWDEAHGRPAPGKSKIDLRKELDRLERNDPDFVRRTVGKAAASVAVKAPVAPAKKAAPNSPPPPPATVHLDAKRRTQVKKYEQRLRARATSSHLDAFEKALQLAKEVTNTSRAGYRISLTTLRRLYGEEVAKFIAHDMLGDVVNTTALCLCVARYMGTFASRREAEESCAQHYGEKAIADLRAGRDVLNRYAAGLTLEHEDGRCSWFRA